MATQTRIASCLRAFALALVPPLKEGDMRRRLPDIGKMHKLLNRPLLPLEEGIRNILNDTRFII